MAQRKPKQLTSADLNSLNSVFDKQKSIRILNNKYEVLVDSQFRESKLNKVATKYLSILQELNRRPEVNEETIVNSFSLIHPLILKEFTNLPLQEVNSIDELIQVQDALLDTGILKEVFNQLPQDEVQKVAAKADEIFKNANQLAGELTIKQSLQSVTGTGDAEV